MFYYHTDAQREMLREHAEQLAHEMRQHPDPTIPAIDRDRRMPRISHLLLRARGARSAQLRAYTYHG
jgi:hypothetical protein